MMVRITEEKIYNVISSRIPERLANTMRVVAQELAELFEEKLISPVSESWDLLYRGNRMNSNYIQDRVDYMEDLLEKLREEYNETDDAKVNPLLSCILSLDSTITGLLSYVTYLEEEKE